MSLKSTAPFPLPIVAALILTGCGNSGPDYTPIGDGLKAIGICMVVAAVVAALADLVKSEQRQENPAPEKQGKRKAESRKEDTK